MHLQLSESQEKKRPTGTWLSVGLNWPDLSVGSLSNESVSWIIKYTYYIRLMHSIIMSVSEIGIECLIWVLPIVSGITRLNYEITGKNSIRLEQCITSNSCSTGSRRVNASTYSVISISLEAVWETCGYNSTITADQFWWSAGLIAYHSFRCKMH